MGKEASDPPPYTEVPNGLPPQNDQPPPSYEDEEPRNVATTATPYRPFPTVMNGFYRMTGIKTFNLCGATRDEPLFVVEVHTGFSRKAPLGARPGILLRNGTDSKDPIIAAAGDESQWDQRVYAFNSTTVVLLPPLERRNSLHDMMTEMMKLRTTGDEIAAFGFSIEVGEKLGRKKFEWRKVKKDDEAKSGGFRLTKSLDKLELCWGILKLDLTYIIEIIRT
ncbi:uncharacterized protein CTRU02_214385 [Colletotrichum truncatum]|uniref:Uncharacterized protein n=1 Tax=Colletotrichum truncatum TaxID=5467 RepID=A0ACC3YEQ9_COLTU|nr:uncharacterized protein CTRU02_13510 [Colletotrichum truncatum]KAF6783273.1 hypothetical protein CTRU02_13510 [Colletotrichum truncatum]